MSEKIKTFLQGVILIMQNLIMRSNANVGLMKGRKNRKNIVQDLIMRSNANAFGMKRKRKR